MVLGSTQPLTEMSTRVISWGKCGRCVKLANLPPSCAVVMKFGNLKFLELSGPPQACNRTVLLFFFYWCFKILPTTGGLLCSSGNKHLPVYSIKQHRQVSHVQFDSARHKYLHL
jgi:hypothetical protein